MLGFGDKIPYKSWKSERLQRGESSGGELEREQKVSGRSKNSG